MLYLIYLNKFNPYNTDISGTKTDQDNHTMKIKVMIKINVKESEDNAACQISKITKKSMKICDQMFPTPNYLILIKTLNYHTKNMYKTIYHAQL